MSNTITLTATSNTTSGSYNTALGNTAYGNTLSIQGGSYTVTGGPYKTGSWVSFNDLYIKQPTKIEDLQYLIDIRDKQGKPPISEDTLKMIVDMYNADDKGAEIIACKLLISLFEL